MTPEGTSSIKREASLPALGSMLKKPRFGGGEIVKSVNPRKDIIGDSWRTIAVKGICVTRIFLTSAV